MLSCCLCKEQKPESEFHRLKGKPRGYAYRCIPCARKKWLEYKYKNPEKVKAAQHKNDRTPRRRYIDSINLADRREIPFVLSYEQYYCLIKLPCYYCGGKLNETRTGLDRLANTLGYTLDNSVPCCANCNRIKCHLLTPDEMLAVAKLLKEMRGAKKA